MRCVVVGAGAAGLLHALAYRAKGARVVAVFDPDLSRARIVADACGAEPLHSFSALASVDADIASVCSPPSVHVDQAEALAERGRVVVVEKPVGISEQEIDRLRALRRCVPVVQWRAGRAIRALRRAVAHGELGPSPIASCDLAWARDEAYLATRASWGCGALLSIGVHAIDALAWALGRRIEGVSGMTATRPGAHDETSAVALLRFSGGALASVRISIDGGADTTRIALCGRGVSAVIEGGEADPTASSVEWSAEATTRARLDALERDTPGALGPPLVVPYLAGVIDALEQGYSPGECDALPSIESVADAHLAAMCVEAFSRRFHAPTGDDSREESSRCHPNGSPSFP